MEPAGETGGVSRRGRNVEWAEPAGETGGWSGRSQQARQRSRERENTLRSAFYKPRGVGWGDDPKRCIITGIVCSYWAPASPCEAPMAGSGPIHTSGATWPSCGIAEHRTPRHELPCTELPGRVPATGRGSRRPRMPIRAPLASCGWHWSTRLFRLHATWPERSGPCSTPLLV